MGSLKGKQVLVSGASIAGLSTAFWMSRLGARVTVVEQARELRTGGTPVDVVGVAHAIVKRMGMFEQMSANRLYKEIWEFKNSDDVTVRAITLKGPDATLPDDDIEIERAVFLKILFDAVKNDVDFVFGSSVTTLNETSENITATFKDGSQRSFDLVFGCDGLHSGIRKIWFGPESEYSHFLEQYFSLSIINRPLIKQNTGQLYNVPRKAIMLNTYNNKTDVALCFISEKEISYDYRDIEQQRQIILEQFAGDGWRTPELLEAVKNSENFYFDKLCQIKMSSWTKGRVALVGDAGYCASPASGMGASIAMIGAAALADALEQNCGNFELAFQEYNKNLRPFIDEIQETAVKFGLDTLVPRTEEAIRERNERETIF